MESSQPLRVANIVFLVISKYELEQTNSNLRVQDRGQVKKKVSGKVSRKRSKGDLIEIFGYQSKKKHKKVTNI